jgi:hypothetical protein
MKSGYMYLTLFGTPYYALIPTRIWYKPWRWDLVGADLYDSAAPDVVVATNVTYDEALGLMKILGATNTED